MRIKLDRTLCDGFGICAKHAPEHFPLDDWGYASLAGGPAIAPGDEDAVARALLDCPVHAITVLAETNRAKSDAATGQPHDRHDSRRCGAPPSGNPQ